MTEPQMNERRAAEIRAHLVQMVKPQPTARPLTAERHPWRLIAVTAAVLALVVSISVSVLAATSGIGRPADGSAVSGAPAPSSSPSSTFPAAAAVDLLPVVWHVHDAAGEGTSTWLRFDVHEIDVLRPNGYLLVAWRTRGDRMLTAVTTWYAKLRGADTTAPWLVASTRFEHDGAGWRLLDDAGHVTARLRNDGPPPPSKVILETPVKVTPEVRRQLADDVVPAEAGVDPGASIVGTWGLPGIPASRASITFTADGRWKSIQSCDTGTGSGGAQSGYRLTSDGWFFDGDPLRILVGCSEARTTPSSAARALYGIDSAASVHVTRIELTTFDVAGKRIGTLVRLP